MNNTVFINRKNELNGLLKWLHNDKQVLCYNTEAGYGITAFFHRFIYLLQSTPDIICFYAELSDFSRSPLKAIIKQLIVKNDDLYQSLQLFSDKYYGNYEMPLLKSVVKDFPYAGEALAHLLFDKPKALPIYTGYYSDIQKQFFFDLVNQKFTNKQVVIFIDGLQYIDNESIYDILALLNFPNTKIITSMGLTTSQTERLLLEIGMSRAIDFVEFPEIRIDVIKEIWSRNGHSKTISDRQATMILQRTSGNIRKIFYMASNNVLPDSKFLSIIEKEILGLMLLLEKECTLQDINNIFKYSPSFFQNCEAELSDALHSLTYKELLSSTIQENGEMTYRVIITPKSREVFDSILSNPADTLVWKNIVYNYLTSTYGRTFNDLKKLFSLSKEVAPQKAYQWGIKLLKESLRKGFHIESNWIDYAMKSVNKDDQFLCALCAYQTWRYADALKILTDLAPYYKNIRDYQVLYALTLNRCRFHTNADKILTGLISSSLDIDEKSILLSALISNTVHRGNEAEAKNIFYSNKNSIKNSKNYGYFLRNAATLFDAKNSHTFWKEALEFFQTIGDAYGEYTTITNMSRYYIRSGRYDFARQKLEYAYNGLLPYGTEQLHIVLNNLGVACLLCNRKKEACHYFNAAKLITKSLMPRVYITINQCCVMVSDGRANSALDALMSVEEMVKATTLPRLKKRYYLALAGMYCINGQFDASLNALAQADKLHLSSFSKIIERIRKCCLDKVSTAKLRWKDYFPPAYLEYWSINPISILSFDVLPL